MAHLGLASTYTAESCSGPSARALADAHGLAMPRPNSSRDGPGMSEDVKVEPRPTPLQVRRKTLAPAARRTIAARNAAP